MGCAPFPGWISPDPPATTHKSVAPALTILVALHPKLPQPPHHYFSANYFCKWYFSGEHKKPTKPNEIISLDPCECNITLTNNVTSPRYFGYLYTDSVHTHWYSRNNCLQVLLLVFRQEMLAVNTEGTEQGGWVPSDATNLWGKLVHYVVINDGLENWGSLAHMFTSWEGNKGNICSPLSISSCSCGWFATSWVTFADWSEQPEESTISALHLIPQSHVMCYF